MSSRNTGFQLSLFGEEPKASNPQPKTGGLVWSFSRRSTLEQCARRYYYEYYGSSNKTAKQEEFKSTLHFLKQLQNRYERTGSILHLVISHYFKKAQQGEILSLDRLEGWARKLFDSDLSISVEHRNSDNNILPTGKYPPVILQEYYYDLPAAQDMCAETYESMLQALRSFYLASTYSHFREAGRENGSLIEYPLKLKDVLPCRLSGRLDLVYNSNNKVTIVDWKSGASDGGGEDSLQLAAYAIWGIQFFSSAPEHMKIYKAFLRNSDIVTFYVDEHLINNAKARISQDAERMLSLHSYGEAAVSDAFTPCGNVAVCQLCAYRGLCPIGRKIAHA